MTDKDFAVATVGLPIIGKISNKPRYLVSLLDPTTKSKTLTFFIAMDKPDLLPGFIGVKGIYCDSSEEDIGQDFNDRLANAPKDSILDLMLPVHRIHCIKSLVFNANKPTTIATKMA